jgi:hypothetical protein
LSEPGLAELKSIHLNITMYVMKDKDSAKEMQDKTAKPGQIQGILNTQTSADKAISEADHIWDKKSLSNEDMENWLNKE